MKKEKEIKQEIIISKRKIKEYEEERDDLIANDMRYASKVWDIKIIKEQNKIAVLEWVLGNEKNKK